MIKPILVLLISIFAFQAHADIIKCSYTEPFYNTVYSMAQQSLTVNEFDGSVRVIKNVSFQILDSGEFELWDKNKKVLQSLSLNYEGSDGMSDFVYPYSVVSTKKLNGSGKQYGGCTSNFLHKKGED